MWTKKLLGLNKLVIIFTILCLCEKKQNECLNNVNESKIVLGFDGLLLYYYILSVYSILLGIYLIYFYLFVFT